MRYLYISTLRPAEHFSDPEDIAVRIVYDNLRPITGGFDDIYDEDYDDVADSLGGLDTIESRIEQLILGGSITIGSVTIIKEE